MAARERSVAQIVTRERSPTGQIALAASRKPLPGGAYTLRVTYLGRGAHLSHSIAAN